MDYKQKYEQAMFRMNKWVEGSEITDPKEVSEFVFPELKESEDERIRKALIQHIKYKVSVISGWRKEELIAWLEKQSEQKQKQYDIDILEKHITKDSISELAHTVIVRNGWEIIDAKEQKPAWSEEDEQQMKSCLDFLDNISCGDDSELNDCRNWLKSLKERMKGE